MTAINKLIITELIKVEKNKKNPMKNLTKRIEI
jgi:hypothetical protein